MAKFAGGGDGFLLEAVDLGGDVGSVSSLASNKETVIVTGVNSSAEERTGSRADGAVGFNSFFNDAAAAAHPTLSALPTTDVDVMFQAGSTRGNACAMLTTKQVNYDPVKAADGSLVMGIDCQGSIDGGAGLEWGTQITAGQDTHASNGTSSTGIVEAQSTAGGIGFLHIISIASGSLSSVLLEDSSDTTNGSDGSWSTLITFASTAAGSAERKTVTGTCEKGLRLTTTGTFANAVIAVGFRRGTAQDVVDLS